MSTYSIHPETTLGAVGLTVANLDRSEAFYRDTLGFKSLARHDDTLALTADGKTPLLHLTEQPGARPKPPRATGLYHYAILVPSRLDLARSVRRMLEVGFQLDGASDHLVSEALYLSDPDGNGIEIYRDRPRTEWPRMDNGQPRMATDPLDFQSLFQELDGDTRPWTGLEPGTIMGHVHLHVSHLEPASAFYHGILGFDVVFRYGPSALFVSAGGYHHHLGLNTWAGIGAPPAPSGSAGLRYYTINLPHEDALNETVKRLHDAAVPVEQRDDGFFVRDPAQNGILLTAL